MYLLYMQSIMNETTNDFCNISDYSSPQSSTRFSWAGMNLAEVRNGHVIQFVAHTHQPESDSDSFFELDVMHVSRH